MQILAIHFLTRSLQSTEIQGRFSEKKYFRRLNSTLAISFHPTHIQNFQFSPDLVSRLQAQTLHNATPPIGKIYPFNKTAVTFELNRKNSNKLIWTKIRGLPLINSNLPFLASMLLFLSWCLKHPFYFSHQTLCFF